MGHLTIQLLEENCREGLPAGNNCVLLAGLGIKPRPPGMKVKMLNTGYVGKSFFNICWSETSLDLISDFLHRSQSIARYKHE